MAKGRPGWLADLSRSFKRHRGGRSGWYVEEHRDRLRVRSRELPPRPNDPVAAAPTHRVVTLTSPPGPATAAVALAECCTLFDAVKAGTWRWPDPEAIPTDGKPDRLGPATLERLIDRLRDALLGERIGQSTWDRTYRLYFARLVKTAGRQAWQNDQALIEATLRLWKPNTRARQYAHDRYRRLWKEAGWSWPEAMLELRGSGRAAVNPDGVRGFKNEEIEELRARIQRSRLTAADLVAWDCLVCFGLRPAELKGLVLIEQGGQVVAKVVRVKKNGRGSTGPRTLPAVPPPGWPADCYGLMDRWQRYSLPAGMVAARSPGEVLGQQLGRLQRQAAITMPLDSELTPYSLRHAFALRLADLGMHVREAAELMGHSPQVHLSTYGRRLDRPSLHAKVREAILAREAK